MMGGADPEQRVTIVGLFQYLGPSVSFMLAVFLYDETFTMAHGVTFACIWTGLAVFSVDGFRQARRLRRLSSDRVQAR